MSIETRMAVCSWSLGPKSPADLIMQLREAGLSRVQLALEPLLGGGGGGEWSDAQRRLTDAGIHLVSGMMGCVGEDYASIARIKETGGVMPDATWGSTLANMRAAAPLARKLGLRLVTFHAGFIPHERASGEFGKGLERVGAVAEAFAEHGISVALETGQEPAGALVEFLGALGRKDVGVNFDPANMLLYGSGDPIAALKMLMPHVMQVHIKDAVPSGKAGEWGDEVPAGTGKVDWRAFFGALANAGYGGAYVIEREAGANRVADIRLAAELVRKSA
jgi:L-ribulose-5-phosphate 3-epimerase